MKYEIGDRLKIVRERTFSEFFKENPVGPIHCFSEGETVKVLKKDSNDDTYYCERLSDDHVQWVSETDLCRAGKYMVGDIIHFYTDECDNSIKSPAKILYFHHNEDFTSYVVEDRDEDIGIVYDYQIQDSEKEETTSIAAREEEGVVVRVHPYGAFEIKNNECSEEFFSKKTFVTPDGDGAFLDRMIGSLEEGDEILIKKVKRE